VEFSLGTWAIEPWDTLTTKLMKIPVLSFFTGGGFLDLGFEEAGFEINWSNEVNPVFADLYEFGMTTWRHAQGKPPVKISDRRTITGITCKEILATAFPAGTPKLFGVIGGPPCPDFSSAGKNRGSTGRHGRLTSAFVRKICQLHPGFFVFENVTGLFKTKPHRRYLDRLVNRLERNGYRVDMRILNALELGVPQDRERLIVIGITKELISHIVGREFERGIRDWFPWPENPDYKGAKTRYSWPGKVPAGGRAVRPKDIPIELTVASVLGTNRAMSKLPNGDEHFKPYSKRFKSVLEGDTKRKSFKRLHRYRFSPTACYGHNEVHLHPWKDRRLAVREAMRIQGIPDNYALPTTASLGPKFKLVSNGVPVPMAREVARSLRQFLTKSNGHLG